MDEKLETADPFCIDGIDPRLEVLSASPLVLSTPLEVLAAEQVTETSAVFVRNVHDLPQGMTMEPLPLEGWAIELSGMIEPARVMLCAEDLLDMEQVEHEMVLQCSGNGRTLYGEYVGTPWNQGGVANVRFGGVPLAKVLEQRGVQIDPCVKYVTAEGRPKCEGAPADFEHSLPIADVLERSVLALTLNGEPIPGIHGGPVRLVTPGMFGTMQVKWLSRLRFEVEESSNFHHLEEYRVPLAPVAPGEAFTFTHANSRPTWDLLVMSYILEPAEGAVVAAGAIDIRGIAWNDGKTSIETVLLSADQGQTWQSSVIEHSKSPYAWQCWSTRLTLEVGSHEIWARAIDSLGRSQPLDGTVNWNPHGYEWNGVHKVSLTVR